MVKNLPAVQETWVRSLGWEDPLEEVVATCSSVLAWRIPGTEEWWASVYGVTQSQTRLKRLSRSSSSWRRDRLPTLVLLGLPCGSAGKESACSVGDLGSIPGLGRSPGEGKGYPLQYSGLENSRDYIVHGVEKSWTRLSDFHIFSKKDF